VELDGIARFSINFQQFFAGINKKSFFYKLLGPKTIVKFVQKLVLE
jgi:hypothetical protein